MTKKETLAKLEKFMSAVEELPDEANIISAHISQFDGGLSYVHLSADCALPDAPLDCRDTKDGYLEYSTPVKGVKVLWLAEKEGQKT